MMGRTWLLIGLLCVNMIEMKRATECEQPVDPGPCRAYFPSFYFNSKTNQCEKFVYGGCAGNENRFHTNEDCLNRCVFKHDEH